MKRNQVREVALSDEGAVKSFVALERELMTENSLFISEIDSDVVKRLSGQSAFFAKMEYALFVASNGGQDVARCAAFINRRYQKAKGEGVGFVGHFAAAPQSEAEVRATLEQAEEWLEERGVTRVIGPYNGAAALGGFLLTTAFDEDPMFPFTWQPPYYADYFTDSGYEPTYPLWHYTIDLTSDQYREAARRVTENNSFQIRSVSKKQWDKDLATFLELFNKTFEDEWEFHPMTSEEFHEFFDPMKPVIDTRQMLIAEMEGRPAGFCLGMPGWTPLFRSFKGKIGPIQIIKLLLLSGRYSRAGLLGIGVMPEYRGKGLAQLLAVTLYKRYEERGLNEAFYYPVNESNLRSRRFAESMGGEGRVVQHCYDKVLG